MSTANPTGAGGRRLWYWLNLAWVLIGTVGTMALAVLTDPLVTGAFAGGCCVLASTAAMLYVQPRKVASRDFP